MTSRPDLSSTPPAKPATALYQTIILEHNRAQCNYGLLQNPNYFADGYNPICGDKISLSVCADDNVLTKIGFESQSCALCRASASVMTQSLLGLNIDSAQSVLSDFEMMILKDGPVVSGDSAVFIAIKDFPARAKCVVLPWRTMASALKNGSANKNAISVTTEV